MAHPKFHGAIVAHTAHGVNKGKMVHASHMAGKDEHVSADWDTLEGVTGTGRYDTQEWTDANSGRPMISDPQYKGYDALTDMSRMYGSTLQQYYEGFQATLFGKVVEPYAHVAQYNVVGKSEKQQERVAKSFRPDEYGNKQYRELAGWMQNLEKYKIDMNEAHKVTDVTTALPRQVTVAEIKRALKQLSPQAAILQHKKPTRQGLWDQLRTQWDLQMMHRNDGAGPTFKDLQTAGVRVDPTLENPAFVAKMAHAKASVDEPIDLSLHLRK